jgi:hypothetical protein
VRVKRLKSVDFPTLGRPTSATTGTMFKASFKKSSDNGHIFTPLLKTVKRPLHQEPFFKASGRDD